MHSCQLNLFYLNSLSNQADPKLEVTVVAIIYKSHVSHLMISI